MTRLARGPSGAWNRVLSKAARLNCLHEVIWTKDNPTPWNDIKPNEGTKLLTVNQHFDKSYVNASLHSHLLAHKSLDGTARSCEVNSFRTESSLLLVPVIPRIIWKHTSSNSTDVTSTLEARSLKPDEAANQCAVIARDLLWRPGVFDCLSLFLQIRVGRLRRISSPSPCSRLAIA